MTVLWAGPAPWLGPELQCVTPLCKSHPAMQVAPPVSGRGAKSGGAPLQPRPRVAACAPDCGPGPDLRPGPLRPAGPLFADRSMACMGPCFADEPPPAVLIPSPSGCSEHAIHVWFPPDSPNGVVPAVDIRQALWSSLDDEKGTERACAAQVTKKGCDRHGTWSVGSRRCAQTHLGQPTEHLPRTLREGC